MDSVSLLTVSLYLHKLANEMRIDDGKAIAVDKWDPIKGIPPVTTNQDVTDPVNPNKENMPIDIGVNNKQIISGTGHGPLINGRYRNGDR
jgi:hypothetical protein